MLELPHHVSATRPRMSMMERAAQFSPFAALTGFEEAVAETARLTEPRVELDEHRKAELNEQLEILRDRLQKGAGLTVRVRYFSPDGRKEGGAYVTQETGVRRLDPLRRSLLLMTGAEILFEDIADLEVLEG